MKLVKALLAAATLATGALSAIPTAVAQTKWDMYSFTGVTHPITKRLMAFADEVKKATDGKLIITVRPAGELPFKATEVAKITGQGQVQLGQGYQGFIGGQIPIASIASLPFLVRDTKELEKVWPLIDKYTQPEFKKIGVKTLFYFSWPPQNLFGKGKPIKTVEDFTGRKLRTTDGKQSEMLKRLGASSVSLTTAEVPVAMERGVAEGFLTATFNVIGAKWYEFTQWAWMPDVHVGGPDYMLVNLRAYDGLPADVRTKLDAVAKDWGPKMTAMNVADEERDRVALAKEHKVEMFTPPKEQVDALVKKMEPYWSEWAKQQGPKTEALLKEIRTALGR